MKRSTAAWTVTATAAALLALPPASAAQSATQPPATTQSATQPATPATGDNAAAQEQLRQAQAALNDVTTVTLSARAKTQVAELKRRLTALERNSKATNKTWGNEVAAMDKIIATLLDNGTTPTGTSGSTSAPAAGKPAASTNLDDASRAKLTEVRAALTAYAAAMSGQPAASAAQPSSAASSASASATPAEPSSTTPAEPTSSPAQSTAAPAGSTAAAQPPAGEPAQAQAQPDEQAARKHLTEARNTLSEMTQLPGAAQLSGDARTQISQLISNFNELITTQSDWRASYAKVSANLTALIGPDSGTPDPSTASGTAGAVGTSGTTPANIDPAVRGKLLELRKHLAEFERVATGGAASSSASTPSASSASTPSASTATTTTPSASGSTTSDPSAASTSAAAPQAESLRLIAAIESMLKSQNEGGGLTLDKTQADMLRTHLADLKRLLEARK
jgi:hypothetical protein